jgi:hypothetical protein
MADGNLCRNPCFRLLPRDVILAPVEFERAALP